MAEAESDPQKIAAIKAELAKNAARKAELETVQAKYPESFDTKEQEYAQHILEGARNQRGNYILALPGSVLNRTEVQVEGPWTAQGERNERAGLLKWAVPYEAQSDEGLRLRKQTPTTGHMKTDFGGSTGQGIFVFSQGRLFVGDTEMLIQDLGEANTPGEGVNTKKFSAYHSSFLGGQPVEAAGEIGIDKDGRLASVSSLSGHYQPDPEHLINVLKYFAGRGVDISNVEVKIWDSKSEKGQEEKRYTAADFITAYGVDARQ